MIDDFKIKIAKDNLTEYNILVMRKFTHEDQKNIQHRFDDMDALIVVENNGVIETNMLSKTEQAELAIGYVEYVKRIIEKTINHIDEMQFINLDEHGIDVLCNIIASQIYCEGLVVSQDKTKESWLKYETIKQKVNQKNEENKLNHTIYMEILKESGCTWGL